MKVKVIGAGSIGNHLAQASRRMGWEVTVVDNDSKALVRMREEIYPKRYGAWDDEIKLFLSGEEPKGGFDIIMVGTPPDIRMKVATETLSEKPRLLHLEKPLCAPSLDGVEEFLEVSKKVFPNTLLTIGYNHSVSPSIEEVVRHLLRGAIGKIVTIDVEFREHWGGIFVAHPWLSGSGDSYLGYWQRGGGAGGEHSHALHLWMYLSFISFGGFVDEVKAMFDMHIGSGREQGIDYDRIAAFLLKTRFGLVGRVVQDVVTYPVRKWARLQGTKGWIEWICDSKNNRDLVRYETKNSKTKELVFHKQRPDDFLYELLHYEKLLKGEIKVYDSPLNFRWGLLVMRVLQRAYAQLPLKLEY